MSYTKNIVVPLNSGDWIDTGVTIGAGDSLGIIATGKGGFRGGVNGVPTGGTYYPGYPEGVYIPQDESTTTPYPNHAYQPGSVLGFDEIDLPDNQYVVSNAGPLALVGIIKSTKPNFGANVVSDAFYVGRNKSLTSGNHSGGKLWLIVNDLHTYYADNYGQYNVQIQVEEWEDNEPIIEVGDWNDFFQIFNDSIIGESSGSPRWSTIRMGSEISEVRRGFRSRPRWMLNLSNATMSPQQYDELLAFQWINKGMLKEFLCRNARQCLFENFSGEPSLQGITGGDNSFQLRKERRNQGRVEYETIRYPNWKYPRMLDMNGKVWAVLPDLQIYVGGNGSGEEGQKGTLVSEMTGFDVERNGGQFSLPSGFTDGLRVDAYGGYLMKMVCDQDEIPVKLVSGIFKIDNGVTMSEVIEKSDEEI